MQTLIWIAAIAGTLDLLPQVIRTVRQKHAHGLSRASLFLFAADKLTNLAVMIALGVGPLVLKYVVGIMYIAVLAYYRFRREP